MLELSRTVRFSLARTGKADPAAALDAEARNGFSAFPPMRGLGRYYELTVTCRGEADPVTGYFVNIKVIDEAVREHVLPYLQRLIESDTPEADIPLGEVMRDICGRLESPLERTVADVALALTPMVTYSIASNAMDRVTLRQQYEFSAAHRLHVDELSDEENRSVFGKCNNPAGHGHNYRLEVAVEKDIDGRGHALAVERLDAVVLEHAIDRLDHKHLNLDVPEFAGLNPSVEHIAEVIWHMLVDPVAAIADAGRPRLTEVRVWETGKTACIYHGPSAVEA